MARYLTDLDAATSSESADTILIEQSGVDKKITIQSLMDAFFPTGTVTPFAGSISPSGFLMCEGQEISRTTQSNLFAVIGTTYGVGDGSTTFNAPDLRGVFIRGVGQHGSLLKADGSPFDGGSVGDENDDKMQGHYHNAGNQSANHSHVQRAMSSSSGGSAGPIRDTSSSGSTNTNNSTAGVSTSHTHAITAPKTDTVNGTPRTGDETAPASVAMNYIIKL